MASGITHYEGRIAGGAVLDFRIDPTIYLNENVHIMLDYAKYMYGDGYFPETDIHVAYIINLDEKCLEFRRAYGNEDDGSYLIIRKYPFNVIRKQRKNDILKDMIAILDAFEDVAGKRQDAAPDDEECVLTRQDVAELETTVPFTLTA